MGNAMLKMEVDEESKPATFRLREGLLARLRKAATKERLQQAQIVNGALEAWLEEYEAHGLLKVTRSK